METTSETTFFSIMVLIIIPNIVTAFHIHISKPHIHIPSPKEIIGDICEKVGHEEDCLKHVKRPLCIDKIIAIPGCFQDIHKIVHHHPHGKLGVDCCNTILGVGANACLNLILPGIPNIIGLIMSESCWQVYKNTPPPPAIVRPHGADSRQSPAVNPPPPLVAPQTNPEM